VFSYLKIKWSSIMKRLVFLSIFIAFTSSFAISAEEVDNNHLGAKNNLMATWDPYVAQDGCAPNQDCPPPKPKEECNKCPPRKPRCQKCPPKKPKCQPKEEPKKCPPPPPPEPKCCN
jgi:hypothetical protein